MHKIHACTVCLHKTYDTRSHIGIGYAECCGLNLFGQRSLMVLAIWPMVEESVTTQMPFVRDIGSTVKTKRKFSTYFREK